jgi:Rrf2 family protein
MPLLSQKSALTIAAVIEVALHQEQGPLSARALARRLRLGPRHLEPVLHSFARAGILKATRGAVGGYRLGREQNRISVYDILRASETCEDSSLTAYSSPLAIAIAARFGTSRTDLCGGPATDQLGRPGPLGRAQSVEQCRRARSSQELKRCSPSALTPQAHLPHKRAYRTSALPIRHQKIPGPWKAFSALRESPSPRDRVRRNRSGLTPASRA